MAVLRRFPFSILAIGALSYVVTVRQYRTKHLLLMHKGSWDIIRPILAHLSLSDWFSNMFFLLLIFWILNTLVKRQVTLFSFVVSALITNIVILINLDVQDSPVKVIGASGGCTGALGFSLLVLVYKLIKLYWRCFANKEHPCHAESQVFKLLLLMCIALAYLDPGTLQGTMKYSLLVHVIGLIVGIALSVVYLCTKPYLVRFANKMSKF